MSGNRDCDTIFALSSGSPPAGVAVIRLSGPDAGTALMALFGRLPEPRLASYGVIRAGGRDIDRGLVLWFPAPKSFTGEDCAELQLHGGRAVVAAALTALAQMPGLRLAEPGEFTRRAFFNSKLDLTEVEGLADLIAAETESQRRQALRQAAGSGRATFEGWRSRLIRCRALIEAELDFPDEEDVPGSVSDEVWLEARSLAEDMRGQLAVSSAAERLRNGLEVVLMGRPNAGKSSLLNALARREAAIVTAEAGTTRDLIEMHLDLAGYPVTVVDTAGMREASGVVEREGIRRARQRGAAADLVVWLSAVDDPAPADPGIGAEVWTVATKCDLPAVDVAGAVPARLSISVASGDGLSAFEAELARFAADRFAGAEDAVVTRVRHAQGVGEAIAHIEAAVAGEGRGVELRAEDLRRAADALGRITGRIDVEDLLDVVFGEFCIGK
ncbi:MAG: tRNA uridine-5-carboxymethylaminomethyl(34) synthesis GTPase MnmE [Ancalomicrobiaceae bacterium]|nr:tRNA uridine-5-carboxymethylaminomethyl(34) synthesis GTPase MnmE [Ancalomicrobiaceae bacterium]